ncbi:MAG: hypothetical protein GF353_26790 [Candidatus Lokiarchaeota archaeon]|nr:hypothetical protein [Candidatus Lokiarchaeota archaeon]
MEREQNSEEGSVFFEDIVKKTKTGVTFPKSLRDELFDEDKDYFFRMVVPSEKNKIVLEFLTEEQAKQLSESSKSKKKPTSEKRKSKSPKKAKTSKGPEPNWSKYFVYDFENQQKVKPILESAFHKFAQDPPDLEDAMGRVKYSLISFLTSTKTENAKLYFSVVKFLVDVIEYFNQPYLIEWMFEKLIPNIKSKFLYESSLLELVEVCLKLKKLDEAQLYLFYVLKSIDEYSEAEVYNVMNSFKQLVSKTRDFERSEKIDLLLKEKLLEYGQGVKNIDYKIQIVEFLEDLNYIQMAYNFAKEIQKNLPPESTRVEHVRKLVKRLHSKPIEYQ